MVFWRLAFGYLYFIFQIGLYILFCISFLCFKIYLHKVKRFLNFLLFKWLFCPCHFLIACTSLFFFLVQISCCLVYVIKIFKEPILLISCLIFLILSNFCLFSLFFLLVKFLFSFFLPLRQKLILFIFIIFLININIESNEFSSEHCFTYRPQIRYLCNLY